MLILFLSILKVIGIVLLSIIGFIFLLILLILFVPVRYKLLLKVNNELNDGSNKKIYLRLSVSYLLNLIRFKYIYPKEGAKFYILFFDLLKIKKKKDLKNSNKTKAKSIKTNKNNFENIDYLDNLDEKVEETENIDTTNNDESSLDDPINVIYEEKIENISKEAEIIDDIINTNKKKESFFIKLINKIKNIYNKIRLFILSIIKSVIDFKDNIDRFINIINSKEFKKSFELCKKELIKIFKIIKPKRIKGYINYGFDDPKTTAQIYGIYSIIYPYLDKHFRLNPYLQDNVLDGNVLIRGYIQVYSLVFILIKIYFNKNIKKTLKLFKKEN